MNVICEVPFYFINIIIIDNNKPQKKKLKKKKNYKKKNLFTDRRTNGQPKTIVRNLTIGSVRKELVNGKMIMPHPNL